MSKKKEGKKRREEQIFFTTEAKSGEITIFFDQNGNLELDNGMRNIYTETTYGRPKGKKVISRVPLIDSGQFEINMAIEENFDVIFAIDTNTRSIGGVNISISGVIQCQKVFAVDPFGVTEKSWGYWTPFCMEFTDIKSMPENVGWMMLIDYLHFKMKDIRGKKIGIIVDSNLENLNNYNLRILPIYGNFFLPENIKLIYASSDVGKDLFPNQMLKLADKASNMCLKELESGRIAFNNKKINGAPYKAYRRLIPKKAK
jgi:hypothetical protein